MNRTEFVQEIFKFYGKNDEGLMQAYELAFSVGRKIDWNKLYRIVLTETESRYLPAPKWFIDLFSRCIIRNDITSEYDGIRVRIYVKDEKLKNGYPYDYETYNNTSAIQELKQKAIQKLKDKFIKMQVYNEDTLEWEMV